MKSKQILVFFSCILLVFYLMPQRVLAGSHIHRSSQTKNWGSFSLDGGGGVAIIVPIGGKMTYSNADYINVGTSKVTISKRDLFFSVSEQTGGDCNNLVITWAYNYFDSSGIVNNFRGKTWKKTDYIVQGGVRYLAVKSARNTTSVEYTKNKFNNLKEKVGVGIVSTNGIAINAICMKETTLHAYC